MQGSHKDRFAQELLKALSVDYQGFLWSEHIATARPGGSVDVLRNGTCDTSFVFRKSRGVTSGDAINKLMEEIRLLARERVSPFPRNPCQNVLAWPDMVYSFGSVFRGSTNTFLGRDPHRDVDSSDRLVHPSAVWRIQ